MASANSSLADHRIPSLPPSFYYIPSFLTPSEELQLLSKARFPRHLPLCISHYVSLTANLQVASLPNRWTHLSRRRLQVYPSALTPTNVLIAQPLPSWLTTPILQRLSDFGVFTTSEPTNPPADTDNDDDGSVQGTPHGCPNHCLINEYAPGQGIMPHEDGAAYAPVVATVTLGSHGVLDLWAPRGVAATEIPGLKSEEVGCSRSKPLQRILQEPRSLLVTRGPAYEGFLHGIAEVRMDEGLDREGIANWDMLGDRAAYEGGTKERGTRVSLTFRDVKKVSKVGSRLLGRR